PHPVTAAARILSRCVASGTMSQKELDNITREPDIFSPRLLEIEQINQIKHEIDQVSLDLEMLRLEKSSADVTHSYYLSQRFASMQQFTSHLQEVLREQTSLRQRLMKPLCQQNLPIQADLHRYVVTLMAMVVEFIETLEMKMKRIQSIPSADESLCNLNNGMIQLLAQVTEVESLTKQVLQRSSTPEDKMS
ncbi:HAUS augmin-like complex subunit 2, partial [Silurus asotus]